MDFDYIIVQAGGVGSRMGTLTRNKPKALVPVNNLPIIFHLFKKYPDKKFLVIGDYKCDILARYLETFSAVEYIFIKAEGKGNVAGIHQALEFIPSNERFMLIWSDLILGEHFSTQNLSDGNYIGISKSFPCSWSYFNGVLEKKRIDGHGVAGCFVFKDKSELFDVPLVGSFTKWLKVQNLNLKELDIADTIEIGTLDTFNKIKAQNKNRCRPYNQMTFSGDTVLKEALNEDAKKLLKFEIDWYKKVSGLQNFGIPKIYSTNPLKMERINGDNIFLTDIKGEEKKSIIKKMVHCLSALHELEECKPNFFDMEKDYYQKTLKRVRTISAVIPFSNCSNININGKILKNPLFHLDDFKKLTEETQKSAGDFGIIHGDCTFSNTLIDADKNIYLIDARGYFGNTKFVGDPDYDWAKMYYSVVGAFDQFNVGNFNLSISEGGVEFSITKSDWEGMEHYFLSLIPNVNIRRIKFIHSIIWLSLASHCWEDYDSMCLAFYNGVELWNDVLD